MTKEPCSEISASFRGNVGRMLTRRLKYLMAGVVNSHPYIWSIAWRLMPHLPFLLPHEMSYYAFKHLASEEDGLFLDVGANNGLSALGFRRLIPHYRIFSIEANRHHEPALNKLKCKLDKFDYVITGAGHVRSQFTLHTAMYNDVCLHTGASLNLDYLRKGLAHNFSQRVVDRIIWTQQVVDVIPLDDLHLKPDIIKIDAEGFDYEVLLGLKQTIGTHRPYVLVEYSPPLQERLEPFCQERAYVLFVYDHVRDGFARFDIERELRTHLNQGTPVNLFLIPFEKVNSLPVAPV